MKKVLLPIICMLLMQLSAFATHNRAGEITYRWISGLKYEITITTYTKASSQADRCELTVFFGDGDSAVFYRSNGPAGVCDAPATMGVVIGNDTKENVYIGEHTYPGDGNYWISMFDPNRNGGIQNIPNSVNVPFYLRTQIRINSILGPNSSPTLQNAPLDYACTGQCFSHNPGAVDADGDSLAYAIVPCLGDQGNTVPGYTFPPTLGGGTNSIDPYTGEYTWCSPAFSAVGEWNIAILITEYRKHGNTYYVVGSVLRDMQIYVIACSNTAPVINEIADTCVVAGTTVTLQVTSTDPNTTTLTATGAPFQSTPAATFTSVATSNATGTFTWTPNCGHIRNQPYQVTFKAEDSHPNIPLTDFESVQIKVIGPPPLNVTASPQGTSILVSWNPSICSNDIKNYLVYRKEACGTWTPSPCETGVPAYTGYTLIGTTAFNVTSLLDNNNAQGLIHGVDYSYIVVAVYNDGSQGIASQEACARLVRDVPIITHVTVDSTSTTIGEITIRWVKPIADANNLDTIAHPGPYRFELRRATGFSTSSSAFTPIVSFSSPYFAALDDTMYVDTLLNTLNNPYTYRIDFYYTLNGVETLLGSTHTASSVYLTLTPADNQLTLNWQVQVPWQNYQYIVYRETATPFVFVALDTVTTTSYVDTGLVNGATYCYRILTIGQYSDPSIVSPLLNYSEIMCGQPQDLTPPCAPALTVLPDCEIGQNYLVWTNPNNYCSDDVVQYNVYYTPVQGGAYTLLTTVPGPVDTDFVFVNPASIAGCFVVTALDTFMNESPYSSEVCVDNCPVYELPNVFTPDGDNVNDFFIPFPYKYVESIDLKIYDRWGVLMFETTDPQVRWDGTNKDTKKPATAGVYYYTCLVNEIRVNGVQQRMLTGFLHLLPGNRRAQ